MKLTTYKVAATFEVAADGDNDLTPPADGLAQQLQAAVALAVRQWQNDLHGSVMAGRVEVTVSASEPPPTLAPTPIPTPTPVPTIVPTPGPTVAPL